MLDKQTPKPIFKLHCSGYIVKDAKVHPSGKCATFLMANKGYNKKTKEQHGIIWHEFICFSQGDLYQTVARLKNGDFVDVIAKQCVNVFKGKDGNEVFKPQYIVESINIIKSEHDNTNKQVNTQNRYESIDEDIPF